MFYPRLVLFLTEISSSVTSGEVLPEVVPPVEEAFDFGKYIQALFTPELLTSITSMFLAIVTVFRLIKFAKELVKKNTNVVKDVINALKGFFEEYNQKNTVELINPLVTEIREIKPYLITFSKVLALSQDNTPENRLAILQLLQDMGKVEPELIENAKEEIKKQDQAEKDKHDQAIKDLEQFEQELPPEEPVVAEGRY